MLERKKTPEFNAIIGAKQKDKKNKDTKREEEQKLNFFERFVGYIYTEQLLPVRERTTIYHSFGSPFQTAGQNLCEKLESQQLESASMHSVPNYYVCDLIDHPMKWELYFKNLREWVGSGPGPVTRAEDNRARPGPGP